MMESLECIKPCIAMGGLECIKSCISSTIDVQQLAAKAIGYVIFLGAIFLKLPQIFNIVKSKSVAGLSSIALYSEVPLIITSVVYNVLQGNPFTSYGESIAILIQTVIIVFLFWAYAKPKVPSNEILMTLAVFGIVTSVSLKLPTDLQPLLILSNIPLLLSARIPQIWENYKQKSTGPISAVTMFLQFAGSAVRVLTTILEIGWDISLLASFAISSLLSGIILLQIILYRNNGKKDKKQE